LLSNALKFTRQGKIGIEVNFEKLSQTLSFAISDTGTGIRKVDQIKLFQMFGKLQYTANTHNQQGIGLGLNVCKRIVTAYNGNISLESELDRGSVFTFSFKVDNEDNK